MVVHEEAEDEYSFANCQGGILRILVVGARSYALEV